MFMCALASDCHEPRGTRVAVPHMRTWEEHIVRRVDCGRATRPPVLRGHLAAAATATLFRRFARMSSPKTDWAGPLNGGKPSSSSSPKPGRQAAKKLRSYLAKVKYGGIDTSHIEVGFLEVTHEGRRKSGVEAWSERIQYQLVELSFHDFLQRFPTDEAVLPHVHLVKYVKEKGQLVLSFHTQQEHDPARVQLMIAAGEASVGVHLGADGIGPHLSSEFSSPEPSPPQERGDELKRMTEGMRSIRVTSCGEASTSEEASAGRCVAMDVPHHCWHAILARLDVKGIAAVSCAAGWLRRITWELEVWLPQHERIYGEPPRPLRPGRELDAGWIRRRCVKSSAELARWQPGRMRMRPGLRLGQRPREVDMAAPFVWMDGMKAITAADGKLTLWLHNDDDDDGGESTEGSTVCGKKIATVPTQLQERISCFAADANVMLAGFSPGVLQVFSMDTLKPVKTYRMEQTCVPTACLPLASSYAAAAFSGEPSTIRLYDPASPHAAPLLELEVAMGPVNAMASSFPSQHLFTAGFMLEQWDLETSQRVSALELDFCRARIDETAQSVAVHKRVLAATCGDCVLLYDLRAPSLPVLSCSGTVRAATTNTLRSKPEAGIHLDGLKIVTAAWGDEAEGGSALCVYDMRWAACGVAPAGGLGPATVIPVESRVLRFAAIENSLIACTSSSDGIDFQVLRFEEGRVDDGETLVGYEKPRRIKGTRSNRRGRFPKRQGHAHLKM